MDRHCDGGLLMRLTIPCPAAWRPDANHFAMALGSGPAEALTYGSLNWLDTAGNFYACASLIVSDTFVSMAQSTLSSPAWDVDNIIEMGCGTARTSGAGVQPDACDGHARQTDRLRW